MAKIYLKSDLDYAPIIESIERFLRKNSGHRKALYEDQCDFVIEFTSDWAGGSEKITPIVFNKDHQMKGLAQSIVSCFKETSFPYAYPDGKNQPVGRQLLQIRLGRKHQEIPLEEYGQLIAEGIIKYFNPEYISAGNKEKEPLRKKPQDKTYYDRTFNNNATSNSSILFKKGAR
jgi:hypothetical protein